MRHTPARSMWYLRLLAVCAVVFARGGPKGQPRVSLQFHTMDACKGVPSFFDVVNSTIGRTQKGGAQYLSAVFNNRKEAKNFKKVELTLTKCDDAVSFNTCSYDTTYRVSVGLCQFIVAPNMPWSSVVKALHPPASCPLPIGTFHLVNATVDMETAMKSIPPSLPLFNKVWIADVRVFNEKNEVHMCVSTSYSFINLRN